MRTEIEFVERVLKSTRVPIKAYGVISSAAEHSLLPRNGPMDSMDAWTCGNISCVGYFGSNLLEIQILEAVAEEAVHHFF